MDVITLPNSVPQTIAAIGALGTAAFGLVDASKVFGGSVNHFGFSGIRNLVRAFLPADASTKNGPSFGNDEVLATLKANWFNGTDLANQKAIAKTLVKLKLTSANAADWAGRTGVDAAALTSAAKKIEAGTTALVPNESDVYGRFDLALTALLDEAYQRGDTAYRNRTRGVAMVVAVVLAIAATLLISTADHGPTGIFQAVLVGLLATPIAPIAKDLSSALATAVNTMQAVKKA